MFRLFSAELKGLYLGTNTDLPFAVLSELLAVLGYARELTDGPVDVRPVGQTGPVHPHSRRTSSGISYPAIRHAWRSPKGHHLGSGVCMAGAPGGTAFGSFGTPHCLHFVFLELGKG